MSFAATRGRPRRAGRRLPPALPLLLVVCAAALLAAPASAQRSGPALDARAWLLVDAEDGAELAAHDPREELPIASATKLMTAYVALRELRPRETVRAAPYNALPVESLLGLSEGERVSVRDLLYSLILASANDGAVTLAEAASGSVSAFVEEMNATADALGLEHTSYANPVGFDDPANYSSARDLATLTRRLLEDPLFRRVADTESWSVSTDRATHEFDTRNVLLTSEPWLTGVKTGHTLGAGYVLVGSATRAGSSLISVVLGAPSEAARDAETLELLEYGFSLYRPERAVRRGETLARPEVDSGGTVSLRAARAVTVRARRDQEVETTVRAPDELEGPIRRGERLGRVRVSVEGESAGTTPLVAATSAPAAGFTDEVEERLGVSAWVLVAAVVAVVILIAAALIRRGRRAA